MRTLLLAVALLGSACEPVTYTAAGAPMTCYRTDAVRMALTGPAVIRVPADSTLEAMLWSGQFDWPAWAATADDADVHWWVPPVEVPCP